MSINKKIIETESAVPIENFNIVTYTGDGTPNQFIDVGFTPDFVWIKSRNATEYHNLIDSSRTAGCFLNSNINGAEDCNASHARTTTGGFDTKGNPNGSGTSYVAYCWRANGGTTSSNTDGSITSTVQANQDAGFSIVTWTGDGNVSTVGHGLSAAPDMIIIKRLDGGTGFNWIVGHSSLSFTSNETLTLDGTGAIATWNYFNATAPTSTSFSLGTGANTGSVNSNGGNYIAYCWHSVSGYSKFGSYTGTGSTGNSVTGLGFQPDWIMIRNISISGQNWTIYDSVRGDGDVFLQANNSGAEATGRDISFDSNGFTVNNTDSNTNGNGNTMIYMAFKIN